MMQLARLSGVIDIQRGNMPEDWSHVPDWSLDGYPLEGIYRHNVLRANMEMKMILEDLGLEPGSISDSDKVNLARHHTVSTNPVLTEDARSGNIDDYNVSGNPFIK